MEWQKGQAMRPSYNRWQRLPEVFADDTRPGADGFVYCKGCGQPLESRARIAQRKSVVSVMMCETCQATHGHELMPTQGAPTFCYRCGGPDELFIQSGISPVTYHVCPRCLPERAARYRAQDFEAPQRSFPSDKGAQDGQAAS